MDLIRATNIADTGQREPVPNIKTYFALFRGEANATVAEVHFHICVTGLTPAAASQVHSS